MTSVPERLRRELGRVLESVIPADSPVALLDFPTHANVGDYAIWLGQMAYLRRTSRAVVYACAHWDYCPERIDERLGDGTILLHGGGNLGDLWVTHQELRERVLSDFPDRRVIQLPQSVHFCDPDRLDSAKRAFGSHPNFTLLVRDERSLVFAREAFDCDVMLSPDSAFELHPLTRTREAARQVVCLARTDQESVLLAEFAKIDGAEVVDWVHDPNRLYAMVRQAVLSVGQLSIKSGMSAHLLAGPTRAGFEVLAKSQLRLGVRILSGGKVVVTDRLHGHILCLMLGVPHVVLDNSYGKLSDFHATWTSSSHLGRRARHPGDAVAMATEWAAAVKDRGLNGGNPSAAAIP